MNHKRNLIFAGLMLALLSLYASSRPSRPVSEPKHWVALLTQHDTSPPTAIVLENTLSGNITFYRGGEGIYGLGLDGEFPADKTWVVYGQPLDLDVNSGTPDLIIRHRILGPNEVDIFTARQEDVDPPNAIYLNRDNLLNATPIEIRVYQP